RASADRRCYVASAAAPCAELRHRGLPSGTFQPVTSFSDLRGSFCTFCESQKKLRNHLNAYKSSSRDILSTVDRAAMGVRTRYVGNGGNRMSGGGIKSITRARQREYMNTYGGGGIIGLPSALVSSVLLGGL